MMDLPNTSTPSSQGQSRAPTRLTIGAPLATTVTPPRSPPSTFPATFILKGTSPPSQVSQLTPSVHSFTPAEQHWMQTVANPMLTTDSNPNATPVTTSAEPYSLPRTTAAPISSLNSPPSHGVFQSGGDFPSGETPSQVYDQKRMELMQREVNDVIGTMCMNFEDSCVVSVVNPEKKLQEIYSTCPDSGIKWGECDKGLAEGQKEATGRLRRFGRKMAILLGLLLLIGLFFLGNWMISEWFIVQESRQEMIEALLKKQKILEVGLDERNISGNGTNSTTGFEGITEESTVVIVDAIIKDQSLSSGQSVLDPALFGDDDDYDED